MITYNKEQIAEDITFLFKNAGKIHPDLYHQVSNSVLNKKGDSLIRVIPDALSPLMAYRYLSIATAFVKEDHTGISVPKLIREQMRGGVFSLFRQILDYSGYNVEANLITADQKYGVLNQKH